MTTARPTRSWLCAKRRDMEMYCAAGRASSSSSSSSRCPSQWLEVPSLRSIKLCKTRLRGEIRAHYPSATRHRHGFDSPPTCSGREAQETLQNFVQGVLEPHAACGV